MDLWVWTVCQFRPRGLRNPNARRVTLTISNAQPCKAGLALLMWLWKRVQLSNWNWLMSSLLPVLHPCLSIVSHNLTYPLLPICRDYSKVFEWTFELLCIWIGFSNSFAPTGCTVSIVVLHRLKGWVKLPNELKNGSQKVRRVNPCFSDGDLYTFGYFWYLLVFFWDPSLEALMACSDSSAIKQSRWHSAGRSATGETSCHLHWTTVP